MIKSLEPLSASLSGLFLRREELTIMYCLSDSAQAGYTFPCSAALPDFTLGIGDYRAVVPGEYINYAPAGSKCFGGIQSSASVGINLYGDVFFKSQFVIFDGSSTPRVGFAPKAA
jgi:hypothetical protein